MSEYITLQRRTSFLSWSRTHSFEARAFRPELSPLIPSSTFFSNTQTLTSFPVVLCVAPRTRQRPTVKLLEGEADVEVEGRWVDEEEGEGALWSV